MFPPTPQATEETAMDKTIARPPVATEAEWRQAREELLVKEKELTRSDDSLAAERRRLPMVPIEKEYAFEGPDGETDLPGLFDGRNQLILYHFMLTPGGDPCIGCSYFADYVGPLEHLHDRDISMVLVSLAPVAELEAVKQRMGWDIPWYSSGGSDFNRDFGRTTDRGETFGLSVFLRDGDDVFRTYFTEGRGVEAVNLIDLTPYGRQQEWEDSPEGWPQGPTYGAGKLHDEYGPTPSAPSAS
jgi:predicted dithiol-disulfide oxidoreductase (DUF899 family)